MSRHYNLYALSDPSKADRIVGEIGKVDGVRDVKISGDLHEIAIDMETARITAIMERVVNICNRISNGCEVRYKFI